MVLKKKLKQKNAQVFLSISFNHNSLQVRILESAEKGRGITDFVATPYGQMESSRSREKVELYNNSMGLCSYITVIKM